MLILLILATSMQSYILSTSNSFAKICAMSKSKRNFSMMSIISVISSSEMNLTPFNELENLWKIKQRWLFID